MADARRPGGTPPTSHPHPAPSPLRRVPSAAEVVALRRQREAAVAASRDRLRAAGWRWTRSLETVLDALLRAEPTPTLEELHGRTRERVPRFHLPVLRHSLEVLRQHGVVREIADRHGVVRYVFAGAGSQPAARQVVTARCRSCGRTEEVPTTFLVRLKEELWRRLGYDLASPEAEVVGLCPSCR